MRQRRKGRVTSRERRIVYQVILILVVFIGSVAGCSGEQKKVELMVGAAASLEPVLKEIKELYREYNPEVELNFTFASSGTLEQQIREGAPIDIFISAAVKQIDSLEMDGLIMKDSIVNLIQNELVLIVPKKNSSNIKGFWDVQNATVIALGNPASVPAGQYAREVFENIGNWEDIKKKATFGKDVTEVLAWVEAGNAEVGVVYVTDAMKKDTVEIVATVPEGSHSPIVYPGAIIAETKHEEQAKDFLHFLDSTEAKELFEEYGFHALDE